MSGGLGLKREDAVATANFRGSCSSEKQEARGRGLWTALPSRARGRGEGRGGRGAQGDTLTARSQGTRARGRRPPRSDS